MAPPTQAADIFISHASEDKEEIARPLAEALQRLGLTVWFDEYVLRLGDSLRQVIDNGLNSCRFGIVILSPAFFAKEWPQRELNGLLAREISGRAKVLLPVWHDLTAQEVAHYSPLLADKVAVSTSRGLDFVVRQILEVIELQKTVPGPKTAAAQASALRTPPASSYAAKKTAPAPRLKPTGSVVHTPPSLRAGATNLYRWRRRGLATVVIVIVLSAMAWGVWRWRLPSGQGDPPISATPEMSPAGPVSTAPEMKPGTRKIASEPNNKMADPIRKPPGYVQDKPKNPPEGEPNQAEMEAIKKSTTPSKQLKQLARMVGDWTFTQKVWIAPGQPPVESGGTITAEVLMGGRYVERSWKGNFMGLPFEGRGTDSYDNVTKQYVSSWIDNFGTGIMYQTGSCEADGSSCTYQGEAWDPASGKNLTMKSVITWSDDSTFKDEMYGPDLSGKEIRMMEVTATRKK